MKKLFTLLAFVAALIFSVAPSQALIGMPDDVPGVDPHLPFFLVDKAGYASNTGLDTLIVIQEVGGEGTQFKTSGSIHIVIRDKKSRDIGSTWKPYTPNDVLAFSVRDHQGVCRRQPTQQFRPHP